ncbi:hypothetical protein ABH935_000658 [Catenulispora sp. GAS73]|uniref:hypothetical protein n=1 Tax=Catenulispora sp. GAS73 TaxID=3156269 RepID=UPI00351922DE
MLTTVTYIGSYQRARGRHLKVMFALNYYGGLHPEEALALRAYRPGPSDLVRIILVQRGDGQVRDEGMAIRRAAAWLLGQPQLNHSRGHSVTQADMR